MNVALSCSVKTWRNQRTQMKRFSKYFVTIIRTYFRGTKKKRNSISATELLISEKKVSQFEI